MTQTVFPMPHRAVLAAVGSDTISFLNRILTCNVETLEPGDGVYGALLTPQGKILTDMFVFKSDSGLLIDLPVSKFDAMHKRLNMLKLRADVTLEKREELQVFICKNGINFPVLAGTTPPGFSSDVQRVVSAGPQDHAQSEQFAYDALRTEAVFPEFGIDYASGEVFPADINMDLTNGIDFKKGCFVGQEVASRMKRKTEVRKRMLRVSGASGDFETGTEITAGQSTIGTVTSWTGNQGLALVRLDRLTKALEAGTPVTIEDTPVECHVAAA